MSKQITDKKLNDIENGHKLCREHSFPCWILPLINRLRSAEDALKTMIDTCEAMLHYSDHRGTQRMVLPEVIEAKKHFDRVRGDSENRK